MDPTTQAFVSIAATITATATTATAGMAWRIVQTVGENEDRSVENREMITGETADREGIIPRLRDIEDAVET